MCVLTASSNHERASGSEGRALPASEQRVPEVITTTTTTTTTITTITTITTTTFV